MLLPPASVLTAVLEEEEPVGVPPKVVTDVATLDVVTLGQFAQEEHSLWKLNVVFAQTIVMLHVDDLQVNWNVQKKLFIFKSRN